MAITKSLVDLMGGTITVESKLGSGTEFTVDMKLQIYQEDAVREAESEEVSNQTADASNSKQAEQDIAEMFQELQFLAAEDNELNAEILTEILRMLGSSCDVVGNGQEAVKRFEDSVPGQYDAILMDVKMPVMSGYEATKAIRAGSHPDAKEIPIIAMTANAFTEDIKAAQDCGMNAHIAKPIDLKQFQTTVVRLVRERREKG